MKYILTLLISVLFFSFTQKNKTEKEKQINVFESSLGAEETKALNELVKDFDLFLNKKYKNQEFKFKEYLTEISESGEPDIWKIDKNKLNEIKQTNLFAKYDSIYPDSVWYDNGVFNVSYSDSELRITNSIAFINKATNIDSVINSLMSEPRLKEIEPSYFQISLESVMSGDTLIKNYLDAKKTAGTISIRLVADGLLYRLNSENEYFAKRIFLMEMND